MRWIIDNKEVKLITADGSCFYNKIEGKRLLLHCWEGGGVVWGFWSSAFSPTVGYYGLNCLPLNVPTFVCWGPNSQDGKMWFGNKVPGDVISEYDFILELNGPLTQHDLWKRGSVDTDTHRSRWCEETQGKSSWLQPRKHAWDRSLPWIP